MSKSIGGNRLSLYGGLTYQKRIRKKQVVQRGGGMTTKYIYIKSACEKNQVVQKGGGGAIIP